MNVGPSAAAVRAQIVGSRVIGRRCWWGRDGIVGRRVIGECSRVGHLPFEIVGMVFVGALSRTWLGFAVDGQSFVPVRHNRVEGLEKLVGTHASECYTQGRVICALVVDIGRRQA